MLTAPPKVLSRLFNVSDSRYMALMIFLGASGFMGCADKIVELDRSSCLACHRPVDEHGVGHGIEQAHPKVEGKWISCVACHGGNPDAYTQSLAHVSPGISPKFIRNLTITELDRVDPTYLRFINPGDLRVATQSCGDSACHKDIVEKSVRNQMATFSGELGVARYRAGMQSSGAGVKGIYDARDPDYQVGTVPGTVGNLSKMEEPQIPPGETEIGPYQDLYLTKACMRCHTWSFGDNKFTGDFRSSGCTSCHMVYNNDGISKSKDPTADHAAPPHPIKHVLTSAIPTKQCTHCHYRGGRLGISYQGYRESAGPGLNPPNAQALGEALHGHDADYYLTDEDTTNSIDETPPDVHFEAGLDCIDCHGKHDVHGDGHIYSDTSSAIEIRCENCHGTVDAKTNMKSAKGNTLSNLSRDDHGTTWLTTKVGKKKMKVPQVVDAMNNSSPHSFLAKSMGRDENGFSHLDSLECSTCHSAWIPSCYGCHVTVDMTQVQRSLISGNNTPGLISGTRKWVAVDDMVLMLNTRGKVALSMPSERMFFNATDGDGNLVIDKQVRKGANGIPGNGQRTFQPHTVRRWSPFMRCDRCHPVRGTFENQALVNQAIGLGSNKYMETDGNGKVWALDRVLSDNYVSEVLVGHDEPQESRPLPADIINKMLAVEVDLPSCNVPAGVSVGFSSLQTEIFTPSCATSGCHGSIDPKASLDLSSGAAETALLNGSSLARPGVRFVIPGDPDNSYLMQKIIAVGDRAGRRMPNEGEVLLDCEIDLIRSWITKQ